MSRRRIKSACSTSPTGSKPPCLSQPAARSWPFTRRRCARSCSCRGAARSRSRNQATRSHCPRPRARYRDFENRSGDGSRLSYYCGNPRECDGRRQRRWAAARYGGSGRALTNVVDRARARRPGDHDIRACRLGWRSTTDPALYRALRRRHRRPPRPNDRASEVATLVVGRTTRSTGHLYAGNCVRYRRALTRTRLPRSAGSPAHTPALLPQDGVRSGAAACVHRLAGAAAAHFASPSSTPGHWPHWGRSRSRSTVDLVGMALGPRPPRVSNLGRAGSPASCCHAERGQATPAARSRPGTWSRPDSRPVRRWCGCRRMPPPRASPSPVCRRGATTSASVAERHGSRHAFERGARRRALNSRRSAEELWWPSLH